MTKAPIVKRLVYELGRRHRDGKRCDAHVREPTARWRTHRGADTRCDLSALYSIDDKHFFCARHAGDYLIQTLTIGDYLVPRPTRPDESATAGAE